VSRRGVQFEIQMLDISRFQDADKCAAYLKIPLGRLRSDLAWEIVRRLLSITHRRYGRSM
jgi:hypothetical protein